MICVYKFLRNWLGITHLIALRHLLQAEKNYGAGYVAGRRIIYVSRKNDFVFPDDMFDLNTYRLQIYHMDSDLTYYKLDYIYNLAKILRRKK